MTVESDKNEKINFSHKKLSRLEEFYYNDYDLGNSGGRILYL